LVGPRDEKEAGSDRLIKLVMATLTIRNVEDAVKRRLQRRAAARGVSMEEQARELIASAVQANRPTLSVEEILALGMKPEKDFDQKQISDELYSYLETE
jgi:plasmid stability protein